ncbi:tif211 [Symbiodinium sp. CCMP2592]|nr:tif211 [Symbiodinium sp. CCMP2592]
MALAHDISCASSFSSVADGRCKEAEVSPVEIAAVWLHKATKGSDKWLDGCSRRQLQYYMLRRKLRPLTMAVKHIYLLLAIFEEPSWCLAESSDAEDGVCIEQHRTSLPVLLGDGILDAQPVRPTVPAA